MACRQVCRAASQSSTKRVAADGARHVPIFNELRHGPLVETSLVHIMPALQYTAILFGDPLVTNAARVAFRVKLLQELDFILERLNRRSWHIHCENPTANCGHRPTLSVVALLKGVSDGSGLARLARSRKRLADALAVREHVKRFVLLEKRVEDAQSAR